MSSDSALRLSVIIIVHNMRRAAPRSIRSLLTPYQQGIRQSDYEVIVVENGSDQTLDGAAVQSFGGNIRYYFLDNAGGSPAAAINFGARQAKSDVVCIMVDGAHLLTPGVLSFGLDLFGALENPIVLTPRFFLGFGPQTETVFDGYDEAKEDELLQGIDWPKDGYRLFEIGVPYRMEFGGKRPPLFWFVRLFESNCMFVRKAAFSQIGGCNERFDLPGGGWLMPDLYRELSRLENAQVVQLIGEASFHQVHGGISTNTSKTDQKAKWQTYLKQYESIRGEAYEVTQKPIRFYGHMPTFRTRKLMHTG